MQIIAMNISDVYGGHLICSDIKALNKTIVEDIEAKVEKLYGKYRPIYIDLPNTFPDSLPVYMAICWTDGWPEDPSVKTKDDSGDKYNGFNLIIVTFVSSISPKSIEEIQAVADKYFDKNAKGWFY